MPIRWRPVWDKINDFEIEAKQRKLISQLRGRRDEYIDRAVAEYIKNEHARRLRAFAGTTMSPEALACQGRLKAEVSCLEDYVTGIGHIYESYFKRLDLSPTSEVLIAIWWRRIRPYWKRCVEENKRRIEAKCAAPSALRGELADEYQQEAERILEDISGTWRVKVEEARSSEQVRSGQVVKCFSTLEGANWPDVLIRFTSDHQAQISVRDFVEVRNYVDLGFEDRRGKRASKPDKNWEWLLRLARHDGKIQSAKSAAEWSKVEKRVQAINKRLRHIFGFSENPIKYVRGDKCYQATFKIQPPVDDSFPD